jgi:hypothetical protein
VLREQALLPFCISFSFWRQCSFVLAGALPSSKAGNSAAPPGVTHRASQLLELLVPLECTSEIIVPPVNAQPVKQPPSSSSGLNLQERLIRLKASKKFQANSFNYLSLSKKLKQKQ